MRRITSIDSRRYPYNFRIKNSGYILLRAVEVDDYYTWSLSTIEIEKKILSFRIIKLTKHGN